MNDLPTLNLPLATQLIDWAEASVKVRHGIVDAPEFRGWGLWDQEEYARRSSCGSAYCQAGQAVLQAGWTMCWPTDVPGATATMCTNGTDAEYIWDVAQRVLGITDAESEDYFEGDNTIDGLKSLLNRFAQRRGMHLPYPALAQATV